MKAPYFLSLLLCLAVSAHAANLASDNAADGAYNDGWQTTDNGGSGFGAWTISLANVDPNRNGVFMGSSSANGATPPSGNIDTTGRSWGMYANTFTDQSGPSVGLASAFRSFTGGELGVGQTLLLSMDNGVVGSNFIGPGTVGFSLNRFSFFFAGGGSEYRIGYGDPNDKIGLRGTGVAINYDGLDLAFTRTGTDSYQLDITPHGGGATTTINDTLSQTGGSLDGITFYNHWAGAGDTANAYLNNLAIVPEPSSILLLGLGLPFLFRRYVSSPRNSVRSARTASVCSGRSVRTK